MFLCLSSAAWGIVLQALMTATSIVSAWSFAMPVIRTQGLDFSLNTLESIETDDEDVKKLIASAADKLKVKRMRNFPHLLLEKKFGVIWLVASIALFLSALALQIETDKAF